MNKEQIIEKIYAEKTKIQDEYERAEGDDLALLEGWDKALSWVMRQITNEEVSK